jgi:hypothetical protein
MNKIFVIVVYASWVVALGLIVATTLTDFKYEDLNLLTIVFFAFALLNSFFVSAKK